MNRYVLIGWISRFAVIVFSFVNTRLILDIIGVDGLAAYATIMSFAIWISIFNLGLPVTIQNTVSEFRGKESDYSSIRDNLFGAMVLVSIIMFPLCIIVGYCLKIYFLSDYVAISAMTVILGGVFFYFNAQSQVLIQFMYAEHKPLYPNIYPSVNSCAVFCLLLIIKILNIKDLNIVIVLILFGGNVAVAHAIYKSSLFRSIKYDIKETIGYVRRSRGNLMFALMSAGTLSVDYMVMSNILRANEIVNYNLTARLFGIILIIHNVLLLNNWAYISEHIHARKIIDVVKKIKTIVFQGIMFSIIAGIFILLIIDKVIALWTGGKILHVEFMLAFGWFLYVLIRVWTDSFAMILLCIGKSNVLNLYIPVQLIISVSAQIYLGGVYGAKGIVFGVILSFIMTATWILPVYVYRKIYYL